MTSGVNLSHPSTSATQDKMFQLILAGLRSGTVRNDLYVKTGEAACDDFQGEGYSVVEWSELNDTDRYLILRDRIGWLMKQTQFGQHLTNPDKERLNVLVKHVAVGRTEDHVDATSHAIRVALSVVAEVEERMRAAQRINAVAHPPARAGHLMAEGNALVRAKAHLVGSTREYVRKVIFDEPVNHFTMLHGDKIATGGDMLTGVTVTDTIESQIVAFDGKYKTIYTAKAFSL